MITWTDGTKLEAQCADNGYVLNPFRLMLRVKDAVYNGMYRIQFTGVDFYAYLTTDWIAIEVKVSPGTVNFYGYISGLEVYPQLLGVTIWQGHNPAPVFSRLYGLSCDGFVAPRRILNGTDVSRGGNIVLLSGEVDNLEYADGMLTLTKGFTSLTLESDGEEKEIRGSSDSERELVYCTFNSNIGNTTTSTIVGKIYFEVFGEERDYKSIDVLSGTGGEDTMESGYTVTLTVGLANITMYDELYYSLFIERSNDWRVIWQGVEYYARLSKFKTKTNFGIDLRNFTFEIKLESVCS